MYYPSRRTMPAPVSFCASPALALARVGRVSPLCKRPAVARRRVVARTRCSVSQRVMCEQREWAFKGFCVEYTVAGDGGEDSGEKPVVVLVHGFGANSGHWRNNIEVLAEQGWRVYAMDLLGFGMGDKPTPGTNDADGGVVSYDFEYWTAQLVAFVDNVVVNAGRPVFFVANSIGCMVTMQAAVENPALCAAQVFISPSLRQLNVRKRSVVQNVIAPVLMRILSYRPLGSFFLSSLARPDQLRRVLVKAYSVLSAVDDELLHLLSKPAYTPGALDVFLSFITFDTGPVPEDWMPLLAMPSCILWGENDQFEPFELGQALRHYATVESFIGLPGVGHCAHDESPEEVNAAIIDFVQKHVSRSITSR